MPKSFEDKLNKLWKNKEKKNTEQDKVSEMVKSDGWKIAFRATTERMKELSDIRNVKNEREMLARQDAIDILMLLFEDIFGIIIEEKELEQDFEQEEMYQVLSGEKSSIEY